MSEETVKTIQALFEIWTAGTDTWHEAQEAWRRGDADMSLFDPDVIYEDANLPDHAGETYYGHAGVLRAAERWIEPFEWLQIEFEQIIDGGDRLVSTHRWRAKAAQSGIEFETPFGLRLDVPRWQDNPFPLVSGRDASPHSRGSGGVGDVAAERGGCDSSL